MQGTEADIIEACRRVRILGFNVLFPVNSIELNSLRIGVTSGKHPNPL